MFNNSVAFGILDENQKGTTMLTSSYRAYGIWCEDVFTTNITFVLDGHKTVDPVASAYTGTVSREITRITPTYTVFNNLEIFAAYDMTIYNDHL